MKRLSFALLLAWAAAASLCGQADGNKPVSESKLSDFTIGEIISGDPVELDKMAGKVVAIEFWGRL